MLSLINHFFSKKVKVNNQKDLSLGYTHISFDASVMPNGHTGIGMHDITNGTKKHSGGKVGGFSSAKGEMAALMFTLDYAKERGLKRLNLYTDNLDLAVKVHTKLYKKYNFEDIHLTWVPRELNTSSDKLSKEGQKLNKLVTPIFVGAAANETKPVKKPKVKNIRLKKPAIDEGGNVANLTIFANYSSAQKIQMLNKLSDKTSIHEQEFMRMLKSQVKDDYKFQISKHNLPFIRMAKTLLINDPKSSTYLKGRLKKMKNPKSHKGLENLSFKEFEAEFDRRKPGAIKNVQPGITEIKKEVVTVKPNKLGLRIVSRKPRMRTNDMMEMVEAISLAA